MRWTQVAMIVGFFVFLIGMGLMNGNPTLDPIIVRESAGGAPIAPDGHTKLGELPVGSLDDAERAALHQTTLLITEDRDLAFALHERTRLPVLGHVGAARSTHLALLEALKERYNLSSARPERSDLSSQYNDYQDADTAIEALRSMAKAQEHAIIDLESALNVTNDTDVRLVYRSLQEASEHQLHALVRRLAMHGVEYTPGALSPRRYNAVVQTG